MDITSAEAASSLMQVIPTLMQTLASRMKADNHQPGSQLHARALMWLSTHDSCRMSDLAQQFQVSRPAMTACIQALVMHGLVARQKRPDDRRVVEIVLTEKGKAYIEGWIRQTHSAIQNELDSLTPSELTTVISSMAILASAFGIENGPQTEGTSPLSRICSKGRVE